ncbi:MAG: transporter substrate-binding domain-containing protein [Proteobacteria bacterium]|nr:transporter substrate-binding domain-containing protein [Pseudomonadota bacterium]MBI3498819.1 transporter substrate-binding domain-containing protein [Pseudomonadota bacterium]
MRVGFAQIAGFVLAAVLAIAPATQGNAQTRTLSSTSFKGGDGSFDRVVKEGIVLGIASDLPFTYYDEKTKKNDGMDVKIMEEVTNRLGIKNVKWELVQFDALIPGLVSKRWDVVVDNIHENEKRLAVISFTGPAYWYGSSLAVQKGNPLKIHSWDDMAGKTVGTVRGSFNQQLLENRKDLKELKLYTQNEAEMADLLAGRVDVLMEDDIKVGTFIKEHAGVGIEMASGYAARPEEYGYARYGVRKEDVDLNHAISRTIAEMRGDGVIGKIITDYGLTQRNLWYFPVN